MAALLTDVEARVLDAVDERRAVDLLCRTIAVPSIGGTDAECEVQHLVADELAALGCDVDRWPIDLAAAATAPDAPGQEVERTEAWGVRSARGRVEVDLPAVDVAAERGELVGHQVLDVALGVRAADRGHGDGAAEQVDRRRLVDRVQHAGLDVGQHGGHGPESGTTVCQAPARDSGHEAQ